MVFSVIVSISLSNAYAAPKDPNFDKGECRTIWEDLAKTCCWTETDEEGIELRMCQHCSLSPITMQTYSCGPAHPVGLVPSTADETISPKDGKAIYESEQNPSVNGENQEGQSSISEEALSNSDNPGMTFEVQEDNDTNN